MNRAFSGFEIKALDEERRIIEGIATTPRTDRMEDVVEPLGGEFTLPLPFKWQHGKDVFVGDTPVGHVVDLKPDTKGIWFRAQIERDDQPGHLHDVLEYAWRSLKKRLIRTVSIGFRPLEDPEPIKGTYGLRFKRWEMLELSGVTIPANSDALILAVKAANADQYAAHGMKLNGGSRSTRPGASGYTIITPARGGTVFDIAQKIKDLEASRASNLAALLKIEEKATLEGRTQDESEKHQTDEYQANVDSIDEELERTRRTHRLMKAASPVDTTPASQNGTTSRSVGTVRVLEQRKEPGIRFAQVVRTVWTAHTLHRDIEMVARSLYPDDSLVQKAAVAAGSTTGDTWGHQLVGDETSVIADFLEYLRPQTILGKFGTNGIPELNTVPFNMPLVSQTAGGDAYWVGEGLPKGLTELDFDRTTLPELKVATIVVVTAELLRRANPSGDRILRNSLTNAIRARLDIDFINPAKTAVAGVSPASITNAAASVAASGTGDADDVRLDVRSLMQLFLNANNPPDSGVIVMSSANALALSLMVNALGQPEFTGIGINGGTFFGLPVITSQHVGDYIVLVNANDVWVGDEGGIRIDVSREASLQMDNAPATQNALTGTGVSLVSLWQSNLVGFLAERIINWKVGRASGVAVLTGVAWGGAVTAPAS